MRYRLLLAVAVSLASLPTLSFAESYRWVDAKGQVHYTQTPPVGRSYTTIGPAPPPADHTNQEALNRALDADIKDRPKQEEAAAKAAAEQARKQENCKKANERLAYLDQRTARRLTLPDDKGQPARMTEEQFQEQRAAAQKNIADNCS